MVYRDKEGNKIAIQEENGLILITPENESTRIYTLKELIEKVKE